jgi:biopolymer transport protein ExbD
MQGGLAVLATVGSTAPFVGLFGTVWGIYHALTAIGIAGQASIDKVAGPVGEALIMTALGLAVAVPAVMGYNWLLPPQQAGDGLGACLRCRRARRADGQAVGQGGRPLSRKRPTSKENCHGHERRLPDDEEEAAISAINTTPLVDVMLVLLIIFLVTIPVITQNIAVAAAGGEQHLPRQTGPRTSSCRSRKDGDVYWGARRADNEALVNRLKRKRCQGAAAGGSHPWRSGRAL